MADSFTPALNLTKPEVGASFDSWGGKLNADMDLLDAVFLSTGLGTSVGLHVGTGKTLNVEGSMQLADSADTTKRAVFTAGAIPTATTIELACPTTGGTIATVEALARSHPVGTILSGYYGTAPTGFVMADGRTIGDATSTATNRANADTERLFTHLWDLGFAVTGGRGASAAVDWAAHRQLVLPSHAGRTMAGRDNLSGTAAGVLPGYTALGTTGGLATASGSLSGGAISGSTSGTMSWSGNTSAESADAEVQAGTGAIIAMQHVHGVAVTTSGSLTVGGSASGSTTVSTIQPTIAVDVIIAL